MNAQYRYLPARPVQYDEALAACSCNPRWCMRPHLLTGSGTGVAWRVVSGSLESVGEHGPIERVEFLLGEWEVLTIAELEREERERITGLR